MQFSLKTLLVTFTIVAVSGTALLYANETWALITTTCACCCCVYAGLAAILAREHARSFWIGFAIFGWSYLWFSTNEREVDPSGHRVVVSLGSTSLFTEPRMPTTKLLLSIEPVVRQLMKRPPFLFVRQFVEVGQSIFTVLFALCGARLGTWIASRGNGNILRDVQH